MGKGRPRAVEKGGLGQGTTVSSSGLLGISPAPVYYPTEDEFKDPLGFIYKIREEAEQYGICKIVPPKNWKPPFALDLDSFTFPTKTQAIHQLQARPAACDSKTFELEYNRFLEEQCGRKSKKKVVFEGKDLDLCKLFNAVKRYGGYDNVVKDKKWSEVFRFVRSSGKISECAKHVLCQLYREHLFDYETYYNKLNRVKDKNCKRGMHVERKRGLQFTNSSSKRRRKNNAGGEIIEHKLDDEEFDQICEQCSSGLHGEVMLLCDRCDKGWHIYCLSPPLKQVPPGNWYCAECVNSEKDSFGFVPGKHFSLEAFRRVADRAKKKWFGTTSPSRVQLEKKFWEIVGGSVGEVEVMYGSDLDTSVYGSGFPRVNDRRPESVDANEWDEYCASPWNLNNLPKLQGSMLRAVHHSIAGVMVPWLYMGMLFSSFCWHFEDHCFYSMNYHHWGEPKFWYSVPGSEACAFEKVMRNSLPDLFDAQPDLLFQLVTMLNPSVLLDNNVPVYSVLQEPGNFVITFPRSYHGGFNFGLNCAEAVNFAPPDWLPHGGFGAELYQLYHKPAVLSHEELLCVVAKSDFDSNVSPYLNKELLRIYNKERTWRERLWRNGMIKSSLMPPRKQPKHVGVEEDPTCIICLQFLYLSAVGCSCRPSAFVCLEHWEHICECKPLKRRLLYRHTLAELYDLVVMTEKQNSKETAPNKSTRMQLSCLSELPALSKKVKGGHATLVQLAEEWLQRSCKIVQTPYSRHAYKNALKEAEQFLWAGSEMDSVREMAKNLAEARSWAEGVKDCLSKIDSWLSQNNPKMERVKMEDVNSLLSVNPVPCNEPGHLKLKGYEETARLLIQEISVALSMRSHVSVVDWEALYSKACESPIYVNECEALRMKISAVKAWIKSVRSCTSEKSSAIIGIDTLYDLKSKISVLQLELPEVDMLLDLMRKVEFCQSRCSEMLKGSITLKNLEVLVREYDGFAVSIPELELLKQYENDAVSWKSHFIDVLKNVHEREDQENVVEELTCIQKDGALLKVQVDELLEVEVELKKASCRLEALKALRNKTSLDCLQKVMETAVKLQIEKEKLFVEISGILAAATSLEERAKHILASEAQMSEFEDVIRSSKDLCVLLPCLDDVKEAVSMAMSWLTRAKPYLVSDVSMVPVSSSLLKVDALEELVSESKLLKISLGERSMLEGALKTCVCWEDNACSIIHDAESILDIDDIDDGSSTHIVSRIGDQVARMESVIKADLSLRFGFPVIHKLQDACSTLQWCLKVLSFRVVTPELEEVEMLLEVVNGQRVAYASRPLLRSLIDAVSWLKKALEVTVPCNLRIIKLSDVEEILRQSQKFNVSFPLMVGRLVDAVKRHNVWLDQVQVFFNLDSGDKSWPSLLQLEEHGSTDAFSCSEMDEVLCEVQKVKHWKQRCKDIVGPSMEDDSSLVYALLKIKEALDRSLCIYYKTNDRNTTSLCIFCSSVSEDQELLSCSACNDCYHMQCMKPILGGSSYVATCICPCCLAIDSGKYPRSILKVGGTRPELNMLTQLLSDAANLCVKIEERTVLNQIVERALECKACLTEIVDFAVSSIDEDFRTVVRKLSTALKAVEVAGIYDREGNSKLEQALSRNSWRGRAGKLLEGSQKPSIQQIQRVLKEGLALSIPSEDHFWRRLVEIKDMGLQWAETAKKVSTDSGELELHKVFELIEHGSNLPVHFDKELKVLRERSMLYCICRKPYDQRAMIACDKCDEWYHFDCVKLSSTPKTYICPACKVETGEDNPTSSSMTTQERSNDECEKPQTPSPRPTGLRRGGSQKKRKSGTKQNVAESRDHSGIERLLWRNRKPFRRASRKRAQLDILSPFFYFT